MQRVYYSRNKITGNKNTIQMLILLGFSVKETNEKDWILKTPVTTK
jgi:hypothetical protein